MRGGAHRADAGLGLEEQAGHARAAREVVLDLPPMELLPRRTRARRGEVTAVDAAGRGHPRARDGHGAPLQRGARTPGSRGGLRARERRYDVSKVARDSASEADRQGAMKGTA